MGLVLNPGLEQLLRNIEADPERVLLQDRYLSLLNDLSNQSDKAIALLSLGKVLLSSRPRETLRHAYMVYQWNRSDVDALELMISALMNLGQPGKADVLRTELEQVRARDVVSESAPENPVEAIFEGIEPNQSWFEDLSGSYMRSPSVAMWNEPNPGLSLDLFTNSSQNSAHASSALVERSKETVKLDLTDASAAMGEHAFDPNQAFWDDIDRALERAELRTAYHSMRRQLMLYPTPSLANEIWMRLSSLFERMSVEPFQWSAAEGPMALVERMQEPLQPKHFS